LFRLAHISDPHLTPPPEAARPFRAPLGEVLSKQTLSRLAWRRKQHEHDPTVLAAIAADIAAHAPDHIAVTGDLTNFSTEAEFDRARVWLAGLGPERSVTVSPGNHDALVIQGLSQRFATLAPWFGDGLEPAFPHVRRRGPVAIVNLCSAFPTPPMLAAGLLGPRQIATLAQVLDDLGQEGLFRVVLLHHPPRARVVATRKALQDGAELRAVLREHGAELVLHGHGHEAAFGAVAGPLGPIPVLGVPSASMPLGAGHAPARWHGIEIGEDRSITVVARGLDRATTGIGEVGRYVLPALSADTAA
jgi:3',5'-cyclic AMP phosphodiesterase CpdA